MGRPILSNGDVKTVVEAQKERRPDPLANALPKEPEPVAEKAPLGKYPKEGEKEYSDSLLRESGDAPTPDLSCYRSWKASLRAAQNGRDEIGILGSYALSKFPQGAPGRPSLQQVCSHSWTRVLSGDMSGKSV